MSNNFDVAGCAPLTVTLTGVDISLEAWTGIGATNASTEGSDGYQAAYTLTASPNTNNMTCFGFDEDANMGYFCIGALIGPDNAYIQHGAGYWNLTEEELAER
jgi:hypothetical protein